MVQPGGEEHIILQWSNPSGIHSKAKTTGVSSLETHCQMLKDPFIVWQYTINILRYNIPHTRYDLWGRNRRNSDTGFPGLSEFHSARNYK